MRVLIWQRRQAPCELPAVALSTWQLTQLTRGFCRRRRTLAEVPAHHTKAVEDRDLQRDSFVAVADQGFSRSAIRRERREPKDGPAV